MIHDSGLHNHSILSSMILSPPLTGSRLLIGLCAFALLLVGCDQQGPVSYDEPTFASVDGYESLSAAIAAAGEDEVLEWSMLSDGALWEHVASLDSTVLVGLKEPGRSHGVVNGQSVVPEHLWSVFAAQLEQQGAEVIYTDDLHPLVRVRLSDLGGIPR
jgi:hypothetical protein